MRVLGLSVAAVLCCAVAAGETPRVQTLPSLRDQAELVNSWTEERKALIPGLLRKYGVDAWLMSQREYAEDTVFWALKSATQFSARRRTTYLFLADPKHGAQSSYAWIDNTPAVWGELRDILEDQQPDSIALNTHAELAFASGLHAGELGAISDALGEELAGRFVLQPLLPIEVVATMVPGRLPWYRLMQETAWAIIEEAFSARVIVPGKTTPRDVEWWMREKLQSLNYTTWFQPSVSIMNEETFPAAGGSSASRAIQYGDFIHTDFGVTALGLNTDTQHLGYVLRPGETEADIPQGLIEGLRKSNRLQDMVREKMKIGLTGNEILKATLAQMREEGIGGKIYCHATGEWGHSAGTVVGMTNLQDSVPWLGDLPLLKDTYYSIELFAEHFVPELGRTLNFAQEEDVYWDAQSESWEWVYGRQEKFHLVQTTAGPGEL
ncbi:xaa-Pro aminopeptidase family enzyme [Xylaria intraflava]|nr:xaa-Pro aminopeptidase family enzyme [Xylaria intraflava]